MKLINNMVLSVTLAALFGVRVWAQAPLAQPLADFDKLVSQLKIANVVGDPIRIGDTAIVPFAKIKFGLGGGGAMMGFGGGMGAKTVPLGVLIVEGDEVRAELFPEQEATPSVLQQLIQGILERKVVLMVNGLNLGSASPGALQDMAPLLSAMMGQTTVITNGLNVGNLNAPSSGAAPRKPASLEELKRLFDAKKYEDAVSMSDVLIAKDPKNAELHVWKGRVMGSLAQGNPVDMMKYGAGAMQEFEMALTLNPDSPEAHLGRGIGRLMAPLGFGGDLPGAVTDFEAAVTKKPSAEAYFYLGEAYHKMGQSEKASAAYKKALAMRPNYPEATKALAEIK